MTAPSKVELPDALERAAQALSGDADSIRPANGDPSQLLRLLDAAAAQRVLQWLFENEPDAGERLAAEWAEDPDCDPALIAGIDGSALPKPARKALRRTHHRLRSRGVEIAEPKVPAVVATVASVDEEIDAGAVAALDPRGARIAYVVETNPTGGTRIFELILSDERGILAFEVYSAPRGKARRFLREITTRGDRPAVEAPSASVRALISRALAAQPKDRPAPRAFSEWRTKLTSVPNPSEPPGAIARRALEPSDATSSDAALEMIRKHELGPWVPDRPSLHAAAEKISDLGKSELVVSGDARREQLDGIIDEASEEIFDAAVAGRCAAQFDEMAYVFWKSGREDQARACLASADSFREGGDRQRPLVRVMLEVILEPVISALESGGEDSPGAGE